MTLEDKNSTAPLPLTVRESVLFDLVRYYADYQALDEGLFQRYMDAEPCEIYRNSDGSYGGYGSHVHSIMVSMYYWEWKCGGLTAADLESITAARSWLSRNVGTLGRDISQRLKKEEGKKEADADLKEDFLNEKAAMDLATVSHQARKHYRQVQYSHYRTPGQYKSVHPPHSPYGTLETATSVAGMLLIADGASSLLRLNRSEVENLRDALNDYLEFSDQ